MQSSRDLCISLLYVSTLIAGISGTAVYPLDLDETTCNQGNASHPLYVTEHSSYQVDWKGSQLPQMCELVFRARNLEEETEHYHVCVRSFKYNVSDCEFRLKLSDSKSEKVSSCGTEEIQFCNERDQNLNMQFHATNVTGNNLVVLFVDVKHHDSEEMEPKMIGVIVGAVVGGIVLILVVVVIVCCLIKRKKKDKSEKEVEDDKALEPLKE